MSAPETGPHARSLAEHARWLNSRARQNRHLPAVILITDHARLGDPVAAIEALPRGSAVILRDYDLAGRAELAHRLCRLCRRLGHRLLVAGDAGLAIRVGADGLHLPQRLAATARRWRRARPGWLITASAHSARELRALANCGVDAALLGPVFPTASHPGSATLGPIRFAALAAISPVPVYALGGISSANVARLKLSRAVGIAAISGLALSGQS